MRYLGIDPGKEGAIATVDEGGLCIEVLATPMVTAEKGGRDAFDLVEICGVLRRHLDRGALFVTVEKLAPLPAMAGGRRMGGTIANFNRGMARGWEWMLVAMGIPYHMVAPQRWQRSMLADTGEGDTGRRALVAAKRLWPLTSLRRTARSRKDDEDFADALLLAEFGRRAHRGIELLATTERA
jgi:hypothetical protein